MPAPAYGHWDTTVVGRFNPDAYLGFVYQIINLDSNKKYIGCKHLWKYSKGKRIRASEWRYYCGSSKYLLPDIKKMGKRKFKFQVLMLCDNKRNLYYNEMKLQVELGVLESDDYYNANIGGLRFYRPVKSYLSEKVRAKLRGTNGSKYHGPFLITYYGGHQEWVDGVTVRQWCADNGYNHQRLYELRGGKRDIYKGITAMEYANETDKLAS